MPLQITSYSQNSLSIGSTAAQTSALECGKYALWANADCYIKTNSTANDVTTSTGFLLHANQIPEPFFIEEDHKIGAITGGESGTLYYHRVG